jgi:hypothetical protein
MRSPWPTVDREPAPVLFEGKASVQGLGQVVGQVAMTRNIEDAQIGFMTTPELSRLMTFRPDTMNWAQTTTRWFVPIGSLNRFLLQAPALVPP